MILIIEVNKLYCSDNLEVLKMLPNNSIDLIYSDILYNTGKQFKDYNDDLGSADEAIQWYEPRLEEMYRVLSEKGSIYLHMDYRLVHYMKVKMDEIFGVQNFRNHIVWKRQPPRGAKARGKQYARNADDILFYTKSDTYTWNGAYKNYDEKFLKRFKPDESGRLFRDCDLGDYSQESIENFEKEGRIYITKTGKKRLKRFLDEENGEAIDVIWTDIPEVNSMAQERVDYCTQKPKALLRRIISASSNEENIIADFFCGSGTSMVVAKELNRKYVGCDINSKAVRLTNQRLEAIIN